MHQVFWVKVSLKLNALEPLHDCLCLDFGVRFRVKPPYLLKAFDLLLAPDPDLRQKQLLHGFHAHFHNFWVFKPLNVSNVDLFVCVHTDKFFLHPGTFGFDDLN